MSELHDLANTQPANLLWQHMIKHYRPRLVDNYIPAVRKGFDTGTGSRTLHDDALHDTTRTVLEIIRVSLSRTILINALDNRAISEIVILANEARRIEHSNLVRRGNCSGRLWRDICCLGRLRMAFDTFIYAAATLPCMDALQIEPIQHVEIRDLPSTDSALKISDAVSLLGSAKQTYITDIRKRRTLPYLKKRYSELQREPRELHAEMRMVIHLMTQGSLDQVFPYIGASKYCCALCWTFLERQNVLRARGCHDRLYHRWLAPSFAPALGGEPLKDLSKTTNAVQQHIIKLLSNTALPQLHAGPESSAGTTSGLRPIESDLNRRRQFQQAHMERSAQFAMQRKSATIDHRFG